MKIAHHRNGITGQPFSVVIFREKGKRMVGVQFDGDTGYTAVFDLDLLADEIIGFGKNSWRGDYFGEKIEHWVKKKMEVKIP